MATILDGSKRGLVRFIKGFYSWLVSMANSTMCYFQIQHQYAFEHQLEASNGRRQVCLSLLLGSFPGAAGGGSLWITNTGRDGPLA